jgi:hypothetical protein
VRLTRDSFGYIILRDYLEGCLASIHSAKGGYIKPICGTIFKDFLSYKIPKDYLKTYLGSIYLAKGAT